MHTRNWIINPLKADNYVNYISTLSSYRAVNTFRLGYAVLGKKSLFVLIHVHNTVINSVGRMFNF
jgi:hypothetical protein